MCQRKVFVFMVCTMMNNKDLFGIWFDKCICFDCCYGQHKLIRHFLYNVLLSEAEYANKRRKCIVPLKLQKGYEADGWLGFIMGNDYFYDFTKEKPDLKDVEDKLLRKVKKQFTVMSEEHTDGPVSVEKPTKAEDIQPLRVLIIYFLWFFYFFILIHWFIFGA